MFKPAAVVKDGLVHLLYRAQGPDGRSSIALGISSDGVHFDRLNKPVMVATEPYELPGGCEDPRVIEVGGTYYMYFGDLDIYCATSRDLIRWTPGPVDQPVMRPQPDTYSARLLEPGPPPRITENGYILLIHNAAAHDPDGKLIYRAGQALIDPAEPTRELARLTRTFLVPETPEELAAA